MPAEPSHPAQPQCLLSNLEVKINYIRGLVVVVQVAAAAISAIYCWSAHNNQAARLAQASNKICSVCGQILQISYKVQQIASNDMMLA